MRETGVGIAFLPEFVTRRRVQEDKRVYLNTTDVQTDIWKQLMHQCSKWTSGA